MSLEDTAVDNNLSDEDFMDKYGDIDEEQELDLSDNTDEPNETEEVVTEETQEEVETTETLVEETTEETEVKDEEAETVVSDEASISQEDQLQAIYAPFKANGVDISVKSPEEAIRLMQQGAGATKRMQSLAPKLKMIQMLENNDLLTEEAINQLIAVGSKDPKAIAAFLKDAEIDPYTLDTDQEDYQPTDHRVSEKEYLLKQTIEQLADQPKYEETLTTADSWDEASKKIAIDDPQVLTVINGHMQSGIYDQIETSIKQEVIKGNISSNTPFLEAYKLIGNQLQDSGAFDQSETEESNEQTSLEETANNSVKSDKNLNSRRKAAGSTKSTSSKPHSGKQNSEDNIDLFKMSDEDFMKKYEDAEWMNPI